MLLEEEVSDPTFRPVGAEARSPLHVEDLHALVNGCQNGYLGCLEGLLHLGCPREFAAWAEEWLEWGHRVAQLGIVGHLIDEAKPTPDVCYGAGGWEVPDCIQVLRERFDGRVGYPKAGEIYTSLSELELVRV